MRRFILAIAGTILTLGAGCACGSGVGPDTLVGAACDGDFDCQQRCALGGDFPGGFCTVACFDDFDCPSDAVCADVQGGICLFPCDSDAYCRDLLEPGYDCDSRDRPTGGSVRVCIND